MAKDDRLAKVELVREKCAVSYADATEALEAADYDVLDAIVALERAGKARAQTASHTTSAPDATPRPPEQMTQTQGGPGWEGARAPRLKASFQAFWDALRDLCRQGLESSFVAERGGERVLAVPVLVLAILILFVWPAALPLLVVGLFFDFRYHFEGIGVVSVDVNDVMDKAADGARSLRRDLTEE